MTAGTMTAGTMTAGTMTAGTMTAGTMTAGTMTAGTMTAGTMTAGTMTAGTMTAGTMTAGTEPTQELSCLGILECFGMCNSDPACTENCLNQGSLEGVTALDELINCDLRSNCEAEISCLSQQCASELARCEQGDVPMAGAEMAGAEMAGAEMAGAEMAGAEMAGTEMAGTEMAGTEMTGSNPPAPNSLSCSEVINCIEGCPEGDDPCNQGCVSGGTSSATVALAILVSCTEVNMCTDSACIDQSCTSELIDCLQDRVTPTDRECLIDLDCPFSTPRCVNEQCMECEANFDCDLGYDCVSNSCVEVMTDCVDDFYEPNDRSEEATSTLLTGLITDDEVLSLCGPDIDYYAVSICPGGTTTASVTFDSDIVDIDIEFTFPGDIISQDVSAGVTGTENVTHTNIGSEDQTINLIIYPYQPVSEVTYSLDLVSSCP